MTRASDGSMEQKASGVPFRTWRVGRLWFDLPAPKVSAISIYRKFKGDGPGFIMERRIRGRPGLALVGTHPLAVARWHQNALHIEFEGGSLTRPQPDPVAWLRELVLPADPANLSAERRLLGGAVGYLGYEVASALEPVVPRPQADDLLLPDAVFMTPSVLAIVDEVAEQVSLGLLFSDQGPRVIDHFIDSVLTCPGSGTSDRQIGSTRQGDSSPTEKAWQIVGSSRSDFIEKVAHLRGLIHQGELLQAVVSLRFHRATSASPEDLYIALRTINPSPYMYLLDFGSFQLVGASPEMLLKVKGRRVVTCPIAGTRPRGVSRTNDKRMAQELAASEKDRSEHVMLVDLARNDLGKVCTPGSVHVLRPMHLERFSHVIHLVTQVEGKLLPHMDALDALRACFPAGTLTGAPKVRAMQLIAELEDRIRGPYGGAVGYFASDGSLDMAITIRTLVKIGSQVYVQAGAGIVADSVPEAEYEEVVSKAQALFQAVAIAEETSHGTVCRQL